jgi:hypothetical protein
LRTVVPNPFSENSPYRAQRPQQQRVEDQHNGHGRHRAIAEREFRERNAEQHVVGEDAAHREHRLPGGVETEHPLCSHAPEQIHDEAAAEVGDRHPRIHRRQPRQIAHQREQQRGQRNRKHELGHRVADVLGKSARSGQHKSQQHQHEKRRCQFEVSKKGGHGDAMMPVAIHRPPTHRGLHR